MGYYIEVPFSNLGKAKLICEGKALFPHDEPLAFENYKAEIVSAPPASFTDIPEGKGLVVVVDNGLFEAAGYVYDEREFEAFTAPDHRHRTWVLMDADAASAASGYTAMLARRAAMEAQRNEREKISG